MAVGREGGVARVVLAVAVDSKRGPRARLMASSIVRQGLFVDSGSGLDGAEGRDVLFDEEEAVVGGERMTEARRRGWRGLWFGRVAEEDSLVVVSLLLASRVGRLCRLEESASPGTWIGVRRCSSAASIESSGRGFAFILASSGKSV